MLVSTRRLLVQSSMIAVLLLGFGIPLQASAAPAAPEPIITEHQLPAPANGPEGIVQGPDGALWFAIEYSDQIGRITTGGSITLYKLPTGAAPIDVAVGADGALWFSEYGPFGKVGRITTGGTITHYSTLTPNARIWGMTAGPDKNLWFTLYDKQRIGKINPETGKVTEYIIPDPDNPGRISPNAFPSEITVGPDNNLWFAEEGGDRIGRITVDGVVAQSPLIPNMVPGATVGPGPCGITKGADGRVWFGLEEGDAIGSISTDLTNIVQYPTPTPHSSPLEMTLGPDGNVWFAEGGSPGENPGKIGKVTSGFVFTEYDVPTPDSRPYGVTFTKDGTLWFTQDAVAQVASMHIIDRSTLTHSFYLPLVQR